MRIAIRILLLGTLSALCVLGGLFYIIDVFLAPEMISRSVGDRLGLAVSGILGFVVMVGGGALAAIGSLASKLESEPTWKMLSTGCAVAGALAGATFFLARQVISLFA